MSLTRYSFIILNGMTWLRVYRDTPASVAQEVATVSVIVCLCMYVLVKFLFWITFWSIFGEETVLLAFYF